MYNRAGKARLSRHLPAKKKLDDKVKSSGCKARTYEGMRRTYLYAGLAELSQAMNEGAAQHSRWTFYEVVKVDLYVYGRARETGGK